MCFHPPSLIQTVERKEIFHFLEKGSMRKRKKRYKALFHYQKIPQTVLKQKKKAEQLIIQYCIFRIKIV